MPSCPDWNVADLLSHVGRVHRWVTSIVETGGATRNTTGRMDEPPAPEARIDWFADGGDALADALRACEPATRRGRGPPITRPASGRAARPTRPRCTAADAQGAAGTEAPIEHELAVDGIDEFFELIPVRPGSEVRGNGETIHLHCTDGDGEWLVRLEPDGVVVTREHAKGDVAARGSASDLLLFLWGREPTGASRCSATPTVAREVPGSSSASRGATALRSTSMTCSRRVSRASGESGSMSSRSVISGASDKYDSTAP